MESRRFDALTKSLASGTSRRSMLKGLLGLGGAAAVGSAVLDDGAEAARRPTPTPKPVTCPGRQTWNGTTCICPSDAPQVCGGDCCNPGGSGAAHSECCDGACCFGTCYGEELCCASGVVCGGECCPDGFECCGGLCFDPTQQTCCAGALILVGFVCCGGSACPAGELCCGESCYNSAAAVCCNGTVAQGNCCGDSDCGSGSVCCDHVCNDHGYCGNCKPNGFMCASNPECCSGWCGGGSCTDQPPPCTPEGGSCFDSYECCDGLWCDSYRCSQYG